jgi:hypothetical protein
MGKLKHVRTNPAIFDETLLKINVQHYWMLWLNAYSDFQIKKNYFYILSQSLSILLEVNTDEEDLSVLTVLIGIIQLLANR